MAQKLKIDKIVEKMKEGIKEVKAKTPFNPAIKPNQKIEPTGPKIRDMRQEAMEQGSHGASEYFGDNNAGSI